MSVSPRLADDSHSAGETPGETDQKPHDEPAMMPGGAVSTETDPAPSEARRSREAIDVASITTPRAFERFLRDAGFSRAFAKRSAAATFSAAKQQTPADEDSIALLAAIRSASANLKD